MPAGERFNSFAGQEAGVWGVLCAGFPVLL
jgi:hypothetical protein